MRFKTGVLMTACALASLAGCGGGRGGNDGPPATVNAPFATRFSALVNPNTGNVSFYTSDNSLISPSSAGQTARADLVNSGGTAFTVYDPNSQVYDPTFPQGTGRYLITVTRTSTGTPTRVRVTIGDNFAPATTFTEFDLQCASQTGLRDAETYIRNTIQPGSSATAAIAAVEAIVNNCGP